MMTAAAAYLLMTNVSPRQWKAAIYDRSQVIGRHPQCEILVPQTFDRVSRRHATIGARGKGLWIKDLGSSGGTQLNSVPLLPNTETVTAIGDRLSLAGLEFFVVSPRAEVIRALNVATAGDAELAGTTGLRLGGDRPGQAFQDVRLSWLTAAELEVIRWVCRGLTTVDDIGKSLFRSPHTVRTQLNSIYKKLGVHSREELLSFMRQNETSWTKSDGGDARPPSPTPGSDFDCVATDPHA